MKARVPRLRILHLEDDADDAELVRHALADELECRLVHVSTRPAYEAAIADAEAWDIVLADYSLPGFSGLAAIAMLRERTPDVPFILVTGSIGDDGAAAALRAGVTDFVVKDKLDRLVPAVQRAIAEAAARRRSRELEEQLRQAQKMEAVGQLTGGIAHDFNNLLTVMMASAELVSMGLKPEQDELRKDLDALLAAGARGREMIRKLLGFSRRQPLEVRPLDLAVFLDDIVDTLRRLLPASIEVKRRLAGGLPRVMADAGSLEQMVLNFATNARDAMPQGGTLTIAASAAAASDPVVQRNGGTGAFVRIEARDTGAGMPPEVLEHLFEPFYTTKPEGRGTGLGMAMIYGLAQQQGGFVDVTSAPGEGTVAALYLPAAPTGEREPPAPAPAPAPRPGATPSTPAGGTILVADDEATLRRATERALKSFGFEILTAASGLEALEQLKRHHDHILLVVTDQMMPDFGGADVYRAAREAGIRTPFLVTSGYSEEELAEKFGPEVKRLMKPWSLDELRAAVLEAIRQEGG